MKHHILTFRSFHALLSVFKISLVPVESEVSVPLVYAPLSTRCALRHLEFICFGLNQLMS